MNCEFQGGVADPGSARSRGRGLECDSEATALACASLLAADSHEGGMAILAMPEHGQDARATTVPEASFRKRKR